MKWMRKFGIVMYSLFTTIMLTSCWDSIDLETVQYISAIGIDYKDHQYHIYAQMLDFNTVAKMESGKSESPAQTYVGYSKGPTLDLAKNGLYKASQQKLMWSHITAIVLSDSALRHDIEGFKDLINRHRELRFTPWLFGTKQNMKQILSTNAFFNLSSLSTILHSPEQYYEQYSWIRPLRWMHFFADQLEPGKTVMIPTLTVNRNQWARNLKPDPKLQMNGAFLLKGSDYKGWMSEKQLQGLRWMTEETTTTPLEIKEGNKHIAVLKLIKPKLKVKEKFQSGIPIYQINLILKGYIVEMTGNATEKQVQTIAQKTIAKQIRETFQQSLDKKADVYQLEYHTYLHHYRNWRKLQSHNPNYLSKDSIGKINVSVEIIHSDLRKIK